MVYLEETINIKNIFRGIACFKGAHSLASLVSRLVTHCTAGIGSVTGEVRIGCDKSAGG